MQMQLILKSDSRSAVCASSKKKINNQKKKQGGSFHLTFYGPDRSFTSGGEWRGGGIRRIFRWKGCLGLALFLTVTQTKGGFPQSAAHVVPPSLCKRLLFSSHSSANSSSAALFFSPYDPSVFSFSSAFTQ